VRFGLGDRLVSALMDYWWSDPLVCLLSAVGLSFVPGVLGLTISDHASFNQTLAGVFGGLLAIGVLGITIVLSRDLSNGIRLKLAAVRRSVVSTLFGSLLWMACAAVGACLLYVVDGDPDLDGRFRTAAILFLIALGTLPAFRVGTILARLLAIELDAKD
jgi:hypothetical protein